jgi:hypothetical protein
MRKSIPIVLCAVFGLLFVTGRLSATPVTQQQVENTCGSKLQKGGGAEGCELSCGNGKICSINCCDANCSKTNKIPAGCSGFVVELRPGGHKTLHPLPASIRNTMFATSQPAAPTFSRSNTLHDGGSTPLQAGSGARLKTTKPTTTMH